MCPYVRDIITYVSWMEGEWWQSYNYRYWFHSCFILRGRVCFPTFLYSFFALSINIGAFVLVSLVCFINSVPCEYVFFIHTYCPNQVTTFYPAEFRKHTGFHRIILSNVEFKMPSEIAVKIVKYMCIYHPTLDGNVLPR